MHEHESKMLHNNLAGIVRVTLGVSVARAARPQMCSIYLGVTMRIIVAYSYDCRWTTSSTICRLQRGRRHRCWLVR
jgi:hypothetical protein